MCSTNIANYVETLIRAYYVGSGLTVSLHVIKWLGIDVDFEPCMVNKAITATSLHIFAKSIWNCKPWKKIRVQIFYKGALAGGNNICLNKNLGLAIVIRYL